MTKDNSNQLLRHFYLTYISTLTSISTLTFYICIMFKAFSAILSFLLSLPVLFYRYSISPFLRPSCRHVPTCSQYMLDALKIHGPFTGLFLGTGRILRCRPGGTHGFDPVPLYRFKRYRPLAELFKRREKENRLKR
jgi:putative membrane protein insertion efficiency factor